MQYYAHLTILVELGEVDARDDLDAVHKAEAKWHCMSTEERRKAISLHSSLTAHVEKVP
jgi:hypothetical protein